jgi:uncharacterized membrane protein YgdD (TMEM256/DUF423 family)
MRVPKLIFIAALSGLFSVALGAFAAHGLKARLSPYLLDVFNTGVQYQTWHSLALLLCAVLMLLLRGEKAQKRLFIAAICFIIGILCFSGSLYALALTGIKRFGPVTPFGGLMFMLGWGFVAAAAVKVDEESV